MNPRLRAHLELVRAPNVLTALADALAGYLYVGGSAGDWPRAALLGGASMCLYAGGIALNDVCDARRDALERPDRPIPSGRIVRSTALVIAVLLLGAGVALAACVSTSSALVAALVAACIVLYDAVLKNTPLAPAAMGACRGLNLTLGMTAVAWAPEIFFLLPAGLMWLYVTSVTVFARTEATTSSRARLAVATGGIMITMAGVLVLGTLAGAPTWTVVAPGVLAGVLLQKGKAAVRDPAPSRVQEAVRTFIFALVLLDASFVLMTRGLLAAMIVAVILVPTRWLGRRFAAT